VLVGCTTTEYCAVGMGTENVTVIPALPIAKALVPARKPTTCCDWAGAKVIALKTTTSEAATVKSFRLLRNLDMVFSSCLTTTGVKDHQERVRGEIILGDLEREVGLHESLAHKPIAPIL